MVNNINTKYSQSTLSKFDIIGSYFVNLYYNEFYIKAKNLKTQGAYNNITEAYKNILSSYVEFSNQQDFFKQIVKGIHTYCISTTRHTTMSHKECIDFMVSEFVPNNLWGSLREHQKNKLFHESLINCIKIFTEKIITNHLLIIIDNHDHSENITILQDLFLTIILFEKDTIFSKFINPNSDKNMDIFKEKVQKLIMDKKKITENNKLLNEKVYILDSLNKKNSSIILELQKNNKIIINELKRLKNENDELKENEKKLNKQLYQYINIIKDYNAKSKVNNINPISKSNQITKINTEIIENENNYNKDKLNKSENNYDEDKLNKSENNYDEDKLNKSENNYDEDDKLNKSDNNDDEDDELNKSDNNDYEDELIKSDDDKVNELNKLNEIENTNEIDDELCRTNGFMNDLVFDNEANSYY
jgi:hypothetical protein